MKICFFASAQNVHVQRLSASLAKRGHDVHIVCHKPIDIPGVTVERFTVPPPGWRYPYRWRKRWERYLCNIMGRFDAVLVFFLHDWGFTPEIIERGCFLAKPAGSDIVCPPGEGPHPQELIDKRIEMLRAAHAVCVAGPTFAQVVADFAGLDVQDIRLLPLGVELDVFCPTPSAPARNDSPMRVGFFKGFREVYGATYLVRAIPLVMSSIPDVRFDFVGDGAQLDTCKALAAELGVGHAVSWIPRQAHAALPALMERWDLVAIPSVCESFGVAALEASAMEIPVIASNVGGLPDTVRDGETGILMSSKSPAALAGAMIELLQDTPRRRAMGAAGRSFVQENYAWADVGDRWVDVLQSARDHAACGRAVVR